MNMSVQRRQKTKERNDKNDDMGASDRKRYLPSRKSYRRYQIYLSLGETGLLELFKPSKSYRSNLYSNTLKGMPKLTTQSTIYAYRTIFPSYKTNFIDNIGYQFGLHSNVYAVILDAGSTGSRVLALHFYRSTLDGSLKLHDDLFVTNKPGLSSFSENPREGAKKIVELINEAQNFVPKNAWSSTPIALRATAGLRLLPQQTANNLLDEMRMVLKRSPFLSDDKSVSIMDGKDEGLFSWFSVNFLLNHLVGNLTQSVVTLDLGGGSVQITFIPKDSTRIARETPDHLYKVSILNKNVDTYSYSYLELGLMAARRNVFLLENSEETNELRSSCINPLVTNKKWSYGGRSFVVHGNSKVKPNEVYEVCNRMINNVIFKHKVDKPTEIFDHDIVVFSYFFDRAADAGIIDRSSGGTIRVDEFKKYAIKHCNVTNSETPFLCFDLTFIHSLLENGFGLKSSTSIQLLDTIDGHEISWALGAAYSVIEQTST